MIGENLILMFGLADAEGSSITIAVDGVSSLATLRLLDDFLDKPVSGRARGKVCYQAVSPGSYCNCVLVKALKNVADEFVLIHVRVLGWRRGCFQDLLSLSLAQAVIPGTGTQ